MEKEYINQFHKEWIERTRQTIEYWRKHPKSLEEIKKQQEMLKKQRALRENSSIS